MRLTILAAVLVTAYLVVAKPLIDQADKAVRPAADRVDKLGRCIENANGNAHRVFRCTAKF